MKQYIQVLGPDKCKQAIETIGQNLVERAEDITNDLEDVKKITIHAEINPAEIASFQVVKEYTATFKHENKIVKEEN